MNMVINLIYVLTLMAVINISSAECFGSGEYRVCSEVSTGANGQMQIRSWDTRGNSYNVNTESHVSSNGTTVRSYDSTGNEYSIRSWSDNSGFHSEDSLGHRCTITSSGQTIGCN
ncbi:hypothetical protein TI04_00655 [Achromatium sp. WMS2]|nr:hypothetical protein TI04_00655 [Achromatium sp. WMS2]